MVLSSTPFNMYRIVVIVIVSLTSLIQAGIVKDNKEVLIHCKEFTDFILNISEDINKLIVEVRDMKNENFRLTEEIRRRDKDIDELESIVTVLKINQAKGYWGAPVIPGLRKQIMIDTKSKNWGKTRDLIEKHMDPETQNELKDCIDSGYTIPQRASWKGYTNIIRVLIANGYPASQIIDHNNNTMLHYASYHGHYDLVNFLITSGADFTHIRDDYGRLPIHEATSEGCVDIIKLLTENGANINDITTYGDTPLHVATKFGRKSTVEWLLKNGCDKSITNNDGKTALDVAKDKGFTAIENIIFQF